MTGTYSSPDECTLFLRFYLVLALNIPGKVLQSVRENSRPVFGNFNDFVSVIFEKHHDSSNFKPVKPTFLSLNRERVGSLDGFK